MTAILERSQRPRNRSPTHDRSARPASGHHLDTSEVVQLLATDLQHGLTMPEATRRHAEFGPNRITARRRISFETSKAAFGWWKEFC